MRHVLLIACLLASSLSGYSQNSSKKIRKPPIELAEHAGSAVNWRTNLAEAIEESGQSGKPVFWYVPTIKGSHMDRKPEIDRYMLAGPFSWPRTVELLNESFVPVRMQADRSECETFGLKPMGFIEPGWIVIDAKGQEIGREHQITTFHPARFLAPLAKLAGVPNPALDGLPADSEDAASAQWLAGVKLWAHQKNEAARTTWRALVVAHPKHPMAWKAAMELQNLGPFVHAFETYDALPAAALSSSPAGTIAPAGLYDEGQLWQRSSDFLIATQRASGGWQDSTYDFGGTDGLPNVHMAISAICTTALLDHAALSAAPSERLEATLERALEFLADEKNVNAEDSDEQIFAHVYRVRCFVRWIELRPADKERVLPLLERVTQSLAAMQTKGGAWHHEYTNPFVTSDALIALAEAQRMGVEPPDLFDIVDRGMQSLLKCRTPEGAYTYGQPRGKAKAAIQGSVGRTPRGELALSRWDPDSSFGLEKAVLISFDNEKYLLPARKYDDHTSSYAYGGFFFYYDLHARTEAIAALPKGEARDAAVKRQRKQLVGLAEFDGAFMDSHEIGRSYGTGMALWCLGILRELETDAP
jgi:hypothetical protein